MSDVSKAEPDIPDGGGGRGWGGVVIEILKQSAGSHLFMPINMNQLTYIFAFDYMRFDYNNNLSGKLGQDEVFLFYEV